MKIEKLLLFLLIMPVYIHGQKYTTRTGEIRFEASVPSFEEVTAVNKNVSAVLESSDGEIAVLALMKGFRFKVALMEEHFNESYAETDKYPKATFKGKIEGFSLAKITSEPEQFTIAGELTLHGRTKKISDSVKISRSGNLLLLTGGFEVKPGEFGIEVPKVVSNKVAEKVKIFYNLSLSK